MKEVQQLNPLMIPNDVNVEEAYSYSTYKSLKWGTTSEAQNAIISKEVINMINRWRKEYRSKGLKPNFSMMEFYLDVHVMDPTLIRFSKELPS